MYRLANYFKLLCLPLGIILSCGAFATDKFPGIGRDATPAEVAAWDIDVRPDFKGLRKGSGTTARGQEIWDGRCATCHGTFGELNDVYTPIVGGTTEEDIKTGRVAALRDNKQPHRTTFMKVATVSTLWDFVYRAMPWNAPRTLSVDDTYAVVAYMLSLAEIVPQDFTLSDQNIAEVQQRMPNRNGMVQFPGLWNVNGKSDVNNTRCMTNCSQHLTIGSSLPPYVRNDNGNLSEQNRQWGPYRGVDTTKPPLANLPGKTGFVLVSAEKKEKLPQELFKAHNCATCHAPASHLIGPALSEVAAKYKGQSDAMAKLQKKVKLGGSGVWGSVPMPPHAHVPDEDINKMLTWILSGK